MLKFAESIMMNLPFEPTDQQVELIAALARFCQNSTLSDTVFLLNGYAGTGKTSVMGALVRALRQYDIPTILLASTGRAAKVFGNFTGMPAHTIHRKIYRAPSIGPDGKIIATVATNPHEGAIFIVDEASMIGDGTDGGANLLEDLVMYVYSGINCKLILLGDTAQLPPVGLQKSPAMDVATLKRLGLNVTHATITRTVRQKRRSGILYNATLLRRALQKSPLPEPELRATGFSDINIVAPEDLEDALQTSLSEWGEGNTILITRSNRRAVEFNMAIRRVIYDREELLVKGERLIVAKNNYYWTRPSIMQQNGGLPEPGARTMDFIANGEAAIVEEIFSNDMYAGMRFANVRLYFPDHDTRIEAKINLDTLLTETAHLDDHRQQTLATTAIIDSGLSPETSSPRQQREALKANPFANALQVKYAYAVTCHKAQGGQWDSVFIDMGYIPIEAYGNLDFFRWLYTAITRATSSLYLINPNLHII